MVSSVGRVGEYGVSRDMIANAMEAPINTRLGP